MAVKLPGNPKDEEVDMAPMIDMVFLLLVFFMVASHLKNKDFIDLTIPSAAAAKIPEDRTHRIVVSVDEEGTIFLGDREIEAEVLGEVMKKRNQEMMREFGEDTRLKLLLRGHADSRHKDIKKVQQIASEAGILDHIFAALEESD